MGFRAYDCAVASRQRDCAEFLLLLDVSLGVSRDLVVTKVARDSLQQENNELRGYFRYRAESFSFYHRKGC